MTPLQATALAIRIFGIFVLVRVLQMLPWLAFGGRVNAVVVAGVGASLVVGCLLLLAPVVVARCLTSDEDKEAECDDYHAIAYSLVGLYLATLALASIAPAIVEALLRDPDNSPPVALWSLSGVTLALQFLLFGVGSLLFLRGRGLARVFQRLFGRRRPPELAPIDSVEPDRSQAVAFSVLGLYFIVMGLSGLVQQLKSTLEIMQIFWDERGTSFLRHWSWEMGSAALLKVVVGILLFRNSRWLALHWARIQIRAQDHPSG